MNGFHRDDAVRVAFAASLVVLGAHALVTQSIAGVWGPVPAFVPGQAALPWLIGALVAACGAALSWRRTMPAAARVLLGWLMLWLLCARLVEAIGAPAVEGYWSGCGETLVPLAATWLLVKRDDAAARVVGRWLYGLALIPFGLAHLVYLKETASLVPAWLPAPRTWALATGVAYLAAALALLAGVGARFAAVLVALQVGAFTALVWLPIVARGRAGPSAWSETVISLMLTTAACVIAQALRPAGRQWPSPSSSSAASG